MNETRYAILIGINHYTDQRSLKYSVGDVTKMCNALISHCGFRKEHIYQLTSTEDSPLKDFDTALQDILAQISKSLVPGKDHISFYFSGHGSFDQSFFLELGTQTVALQQVYESINVLKPKNQVYIVDACHSGDGLELKGSGKDLSREMDSYYQSRTIQLADGTYVLCSSKTEESSMGLPELDGGMYTHYFLQSAKNQALYDSDFNALSLSAMHEFAARKMFLEHGEYRQTPFYFASSAGYYPYAINAGNRQISDCSSMVEIIDRYKTIDALKNSNFNMPECLRLDFSQFLSELVLNLYGHNWAKSVSLKGYGNTIEVHDHSTISFNPFTAEPTKTGQGIHVYRAFLKKYEAQLKTSYEPGTPNIIRLEFSEDIFSDPVADPCHIQLTNVFINEPSALNHISFNEDCEEIVIDVTRTRLVLSFALQAFRGLLMRTKEDQLIIFKMHEDDMLREITKNLLEQHYPEFQRIVIL